MVDVELRGGSDCGQWPGFVIYAEVRSPWRSNFIGRQFGERTDRGRARWIGFP